MKKLTTFLFILLLSLNLLGQTIKVSEKLSLIQLTEKTFIHTSDYNNGMVFINGSDAIIVSTPASDIETQNLIDWVKKEKKANIVGYVIDRWHIDAMEGLDIVHENGIKSYSYKLTQQIAKEKGLPVPQNGFDLKKEITVGNESVMCHFLGEAHTTDGIVVWIPSEEILFAGNEIRNYNSWVGNLGDAMLYSWSETAQNVKDNYGSAKIVIPGHGEHGGPELIDYTINLYRLDSLDISNIGKEEALPELLKLTNESFSVKAEEDSLKDGKRYLTNAVLYAQDDTKYARIESPSIIYDPENQRVDSEIGRVMIYDKTEKGGKLRIDVMFKRLIIIYKNDSIGLRIILKEIER